MKLQFQLAILVVLALAVAFFYAKKFSIAEAENAGLKTLISAKLKVEEMPDGRQKAAIAVPELSSETFNRVLKPQLDSLKRDFKADIRRVEQYQRVQIETNKQVKSALQAPRAGDTVKIFVYQDKWLVKHDTVRGDTLYSGVDFRNDVQILVRKGKRENPWKFWKKRRLVGEVFSGNPDTKIKDFQILKVIDK
jgi:hypothetical protein